MFPWWLKAYFFIIQISVKLFVSSKPIPTDPLEELKIDRQQPILYVFPYYSKIDLMVVRSLCLKHNLPDPLKSIQIKDAFYPSFIYIDKGLGVLLRDSKKLGTIETLKNYLRIYQSCENLDVQLLPVSVMFGRAPDKEGKATPSLKVLRGSYKFLKMITSGRDCYTRFSLPVSFKDIKFNDQNTIELIAHKLVRIARIHFAKQRTAAIGPKLPIRDEMLNKLLTSSAVADAILEESKYKNIPLKKAKKNALALLNEIAANFSYRMLRVTDFVLTWTWNRLYQGLKVTNAEPVREIAQNGHEIIYVPCHRSHMDYLLLSYVLYRQGLVPPHIAAGINLNFWPAGPIFRHLGAFFIRRSFKGNKLYTAVFREYLAELFIRGYSVEYFVEGGRSRTGRLLDPKTGMLMMTIQTLLRGEARPISVVPVYIGYEHVLEVGTYANELRGAAKETESLWKTLKAFLKLKKLGYGYVNFAQPILLNQFLNQHVPDWRDAINPTNTPRPSWLMPTTNMLATQIMERINGSASINPMNLCCWILLSAEKNALSKNRLLGYIGSALEILKRLPYSNLVTVPDSSPEDILEHAMQMGKFVVTVDNAGEIVSLAKEQAILMTYYRNNIQHLFVIPAIVTRMIMKYSNVTVKKLLDKMLHIYPLIKSELFLHYDELALTEYIQKLIAVFIDLQLVAIKSDKIFINQQKITDLQLLASSSKDILHRYFIAISLLKKNPNISRAALEKEGRLIAERLALLNGINAPEFFDKGVFSTLVSSLRQQGYLDDKEGANLKQIKTMDSLLQPLITNTVIVTIEEITYPKII